MEVEPLHVQVLKDIEARFRSEWHQINRRVLIEKYWSEKLDYASSTRDDLAKHQEEKTKA